MFISAYFVFKTCNVDSDCDAGMCCVDNYRFQIVSKRALLDVIQNGKLGELNNITQIPNGSRAREKWMW